MSQLKEIAVLPGEGIVSGHTGTLEQFISVRIFHRFDDLAETLGRHLQVTSSVHEARYVRPGDGLLVVCNADVVQWLKKSGDVDFSWVVVVDIGRTEALDEAENLGLAATIMDDDFCEWARPGVSDCPPAPAIFGRKELSSLVNATPSVLPWEFGPHYARMTRQGGGLLSLLADYLRVYEQVVLKNPRP